MAVKDFMALYCGSRNLASAVNLKIGNNIPDIHFNCTLPDSWISALSVDGTYLNIVR
jgi:hypothetical protein